MTAALAALLTMGLVTACTDDSPDKNSTGSSTQDETRTTVEMTEVKGTEALRPRSTVIGGWQALVSGKRSTVLAELTGSDGKPTQLHAVDPRTRKQVALDVTAPLGWGGSANARTAVVAGDVAQDHSRTPFVRVSTDLRTWTEVPITYPGKGWGFDDVGIDGDVPLVVAEKPDGGTVLMRRDGDAWTTHEVPAAKGQELSPIDLVEHRGALVLLVNEAARGDESVTRALTSIDGGKTWERGPKMPGAKGSYGVAGLVSTGKTLVATGWADRQAPVGTSGMVWTSRDGGTWKRQRTMPISWGNDVAVGADFHLSAPTLIDGQAAFDQTCRSCTWTTRFVHDGSGAAEVTDNQPRIEEVSPSTAPLPGSPGSGVRWAQGSLDLFGGKQARTLIRGERTQSVTAMESVGSQTLVAGTRGQFTLDDDGGWRNTSRITPYVLDGSLRQQAWRPAVLSEWSGVHTATREDGTTVAVGTGETEDGFRAAGRVLRKGRWSTVSGFGVHDYESVSDVTVVDGQFLMALQVAEDGSPDTTRNARVYSSDDGRRWREAPGTWSADNGAGSAVSDVCELPDGSALALGSSQTDANARSEATVWRRDSSGSWSMEVPELSGEGASFGSCATTDGTTVVSGSVDGNDIEWTTSDGKDFTAREPLPRGVTRGTPHEIDGGLVADGYLDTEDHLGAVVWFSQDGRTWQWAPVEVEDASVWVTTVGDDVYAVTSQYSGDRIWRIDEIATTQVTGDEG